MKKLLLILCLFSVTAHAEWKYYDSTDTFTSYVDYSRIKTEGKYKSMWDLDDYKSPQHLPSGKQFKSLVGKTLIDCQASRIQIVALFAYSEQMGKGEVVLSENNEILESRWKYFPPNTMADGKINIACSRK